MDIEIIKIYSGATDLIIDTYDKCILANIMLEFDVDNSDKVDFIEYMEKHFIDNIKLDFKIYQESKKEVNGK